MARVLYFPDGSCSVMLHTDHDSAAPEFERVLRDRLGGDAADFMVELLQEAAEIREGLTDEMRSYELSCESYRNCLQDILDGLEDLRFNRKGIAVKIQALITRINNEL